LEEERGGGVRIGIGLLNFVKETLVNCSSIAFIGVEKIEWAL
jgi:hypothetical protein